MINPSVVLDILTSYSSGLFGDSEWQETENELIDEMMDVLKNTVKEANAFVLLLNGEEERFDYAFQQIIRYLDDQIQSQIQDEFKFFLTYIFLEKWLPCLAVNFGTLQS